MRGGEEKMETGEPEFDTPRSNYTTNRSSTLTDWIRTKGRLVVVCNVRSGGGFVSGCEGHTNPPLRSI